ncbi:MAG: S9 family peptidase [Calditrichaceae bacterium]
MRQFFHTILLTVILTVNLFASGKELTVEDIYSSGQFYGRSPAGLNWVPGENAYSFIKYEGVSRLPVLYKFDLKSQKEIALLDSAILKSPDDQKPLRWSSCKWSDSGSKILLTSHMEYIWRHSRQAIYYIYDFKSKTLRKISRDGKALSNVKFSPDESMVGYVLENNLYMMNLLSGDVTQLTSDGSDTIINGQFDWVYEEEFAISDGWEWSPDGKKIAFWRLDQSPEPKFSWIDFDPVNGSVETIRYPKAGDPNALVKIGVFDLISGQTTWMDTGNEPDIYIPRIKWTQNPDILSIQRLNRLQNKLELMLADAKSGKTKTILTETDPCWIDVADDLVFLKNKREFVWTSERDGYKHIYLYNMDGKLIRQLTGGSWEVKNVSGFDGNLLFFDANKDNMNENHFFSIDLKGRNLKKITHIPGWHRATFSSDYKYFFHSYSNVKTPTKYLISGINGKAIQPIEENNIEALNEYELSYPEFFMFRTEDGEMLNAMMIKPVDFDAKKKYPVLIYGYSGPESQTVRNSWGRTTFLWHNLLAQKGYIIFTLDNRGTGGRGKAFKNLAYGDMGKWAVHDHIQGAKYLAGMPYVDKDRIGIWGWSGGGWLTLMSMTKASDYFKAGVAVAPVSDFRLYDTIYTERYLGLPSMNEAGYDSSSALSFTDRYKGGLLIVHGSADDNVHYQNSMQFIKKLQLRGKQFDLMIYPGLNHGIHARNSYLHLFTMITNFILTNL